MINHAPFGQVHEVVGVFTSIDAHQQAIDALLVSGFDHADLSLLAAVTAVDHRLGQPYVSPAEVEDAPEVPRAHHVGPESIGAAQGAVVAGLVYIGAACALWATLASGASFETALHALQISGMVCGASGARLALLLAERHTHYLEDQLQRGGIVLWVQARNAENELKALHILSRHHGRDVHVCPTTR